MGPQALEQLERFRRWLTLERRLSTHTDRSYLRDLHTLCDFCDREGIAAWKDLQHPHLRLFAARCHSSGLAPRSIQRRLAAVRSFLGYLVGEGALKANCAIGISAPKSPRRLPPVVDVDQMGRLLEISEDDTLSQRDLAMMELFYSSGLRLAELVGLNLPDLDLADRTVRVLGKGNKQRVLPVGRKAVQALRDWLSERAALRKTDPQAVFVGSSGRRLGARAVQKRVALWSRRQGLPVRLHPHMFRHSFASHLLESSGKLRAVQELLGHANIATTQVYTHLDFQHLARTYDATHPRARRRKT
jgi:integrase/recombinase XerC